MGVFTFGKIIVGTCTSASSSSLQNIIIHYRCIQCTVTRLTSCTHHGKLQYICAEMRVLLYQLGGVLRDYYHKLESPIKIYCFTIHHIHQIELTHIP